MGSQSRQFIFPAPETEEMKPYACRQEPTCSFESDPPLDITQMPKPSPDFNTRFQSLAFKGTSPPAERAAIDTKQV